MKQAKDQRIKVRMMVDEAKLLKESLKILPLAGTKSENLYIDRSKRECTNLFNGKGHPDQNQT
jgi:hypothetical protein